MWTDEARQAAAAARAAKGRASLDADKQFLGTQRGMKAADAMAALHAHNAAQSARQQASGAPVARGRMAAHQTGVHRHVPSALAIIAGLGYGLVKTAFSAGSHHRRRR